MPVAGTDTPRQRLGLKTLRDLAYTGCKTYLRFAPVLNIIFIENPALLVALEAFNVACAGLVGAIDAITTPGV